MQSRFSRLESDLITNQLNDGFAKEKGWCKVEWGARNEGAELVDGSRSRRWRARNIASRKNTSEISACGATIVERRTESIIASENVSINSATRPVYACMKITKLLITTAIN